MVNIARRNAVGLHSTVSGATLDGTVPKGRLNGIPGADEDSLYCRGVRKKTVKVNELSVGTRSGPGADVSRMDALSSDMQLVEGAEPCASGGLGQEKVSGAAKRELLNGLNRGIKRERMDIPPGDLPEDWNQMDRKQRRRYFKRHSGGK